MYTSKQFSDGRVEFTPSSSFLAEFYMQERAIALAQEKAAKAAMRRFHA